MMHVRRFPRLLMMIALAAGLFSAVRCDGEPSGPEQGNVTDPPPENPPANPGQAQFDRSVLLLPGGKRAIVTYFLWDPAQKRWFEYGSRDVPATNVAPQMGAGARSGVMSGAGSDPASSSSAAASNTALFVGGVGPDGEFAARSAYLYDFGAHVWERLEMVEPRTGHTLTILGNGRALVAGGWDGVIDRPAIASAEVFSLSSRSFTATASMALARTHHGAALLPDGKVLISGGFVPTGNGAEGASTASAEIFDPADGTFAATSALAVPRSNHTAITLADGRVLVVGGNGNTGRLRSAEIFTPSTAGFTMLPDIAGVHGNGHTATLLESGMVLILGGRDQDFNPSAVAELFNPATSSFKSAGTMTVPRSDHFAVRLDDGRVLIGGGWTLEGDIAQSAEIYDPAANTFTQAAAPPLPGVEWTAVFLSRQ